MSANRVVRPVWQQVRESLRCVFNHEVPAGGWVRFNPVSRTSICAACAKVEYGIERPDRPFTFRREAAQDVRARQVGGD